MVDDSQAYREAEMRFWHDTAGVEPDQRRVELSRLRTTVRVQEWGDGPVLLFVHGGPNAGSTWAPLVQHLGDFRCLMVDRPGCGMSREPAHLTGSVRDSMASFLGELLTELAVQVEGLVGSSFGSFTILANELGDRASGLPTVHFGCPALAPGSRLPFRFMLQMIPGLRRLMLRLEPPTVATAERAFRMIGHGKSMDRGLIAPAAFVWYAALLAHTPTRENDLALFGRIRGGDRLSVGELEGVSSPTSLFWGADDPFGGSDVARKVATAIPDAELQIVPESGHLPWLDAPEAAAQHVRSFMSRHVNLPARDDD